MKGLEEAAAYVSGKADNASFRVHVPESIDVKAIRKNLKLTQAQFADRFGFTIGAVQDWEQGRRTPEASARILLKLVERRPEIVEEVLAEAS